MAMVDFQALALRDFQATAIQTHQMQNGRVDIGHIMAIFNCVKSEFVRRAVYRPAFDPAACHPDAESERVVIASRYPLSSRSATEFGGLNHQGRFE